MEVKDLRYSRKGESGTIGYVQLLNAIREYIAVNHAREIYQHTTGGRSDAAIIQKYVDRFLIINDVESADDTRDGLITRLLSDMAGYSILDKYMDMEGIEEININSWDCIWVNTGGNDRLIPETFYNPQHSADIIKRMVQHSNAIIDESSPVVTAEIREGVRIAACQIPVMDLVDGMSASIRFVNPNVISEEEMLANGSAVIDEIEFLEFCIDYGVSVAIAGPTGGGKTTLGAWAIKKLARKKRIVCIEEGSRELNLKVMDERTGRPSNNVIHLKATKDVSQKQLLQIALRYHPDVIFVGEMRGDESYIAQEAARTGHVVITTIHSMDAESTPEKMATLSQTAANLDFDTLMRLMVAGFPITCYVNQLQDKSRRIMEIMEFVNFRAATGLECRSIFRFEVTDNIQHPDRVEIVGSHQRVGGISPKLSRRLLDNGAPRRLVDRYAEGGEDPASTQAG